VAKTDIDAVIDLVRRQAAALNGDRYIVRTAAQTGGKAVVMNDVGLPILEARDDAWAFWIAGILTNTSVMPRTLLAEIEDLRARLAKAEAS
jgi:hypothetical protein